jgi:hypothetical protein
MLGELRLIPLHREFGIATVAVTAGHTDWKHGVVSMVDAEALVAAGEASWNWRDDRMIAEATKPAPPPQPAEEPAYTPPTTMAEIEARLECAMERDRAYEVTLRPPQQATESLSSPIEIMLGEVTEFLP